MISVSNKSDWRYLPNGRLIPSINYCDQPYVVKTDDGAWLCCLTTGSGDEGDRGQHVITMRSFDHGKKWDNIAEVEPPDGPEASYATMLKVPSGRVYIFYNHNTDNIREIPRIDKKTTKRVDSLGYFVFKYSDDNGISWSDKRYVIPQRLFEIDRENITGGRILFHWNVGKPFIYKNAGCVPIHKVGNFGNTFFVRNEGALIKSSNILSENDPCKIVWETLPDGEIGIRAPEYGTPSDEVPGPGDIASEQSFSVMDDGSIFCVYRTIAGHPGHCYSRDGGHSWTKPEYMPYADGRLIKNPRSANFAWKCSNGKYLYWFCNHGGTTYADRNPIWMLPGREIDTPQGRVVEWGQPEILLYEDEPTVRTSYPDLIEESGEFYITETQKTIARVHPIPKAFTDKIWEQFDIRSKAEEGLILEFENDMPETVRIPKLPAFKDNDASWKSGVAKKLRTGLTFETEFTLRSMKDTVLLDNLTRDRRGFCFEVTSDGCLKIVLGDGRSTSCWQSERGLIKVNHTHHAAVVIDGGPYIVSFILDGRFLDGGAQLQFGFGRINPNLCDVNGDVLKPAAELSLLRIYERALMITELIGNYKTTLEK